MGIWKRFVGLVVALFGRWDPPPWARYLGRRARGGGRWAKHNKARAAGLFVAIALLSVGGGWGYYWYQHRPKPTEFTVSVTAPGITSPEPPSTPDPLVIDFNGSVAPLKAIGRPLDGKALPELSPKMEGKWSWASDSRLVFNPKSDWPIGKDFEVELPKKKLVREGVLLSDYDLKFQTPPFAAKIAEAQFYQDPVDATLKKVVCTVNFSHPVDPASFEKRIKMHMDGRLKTDGGSDYKFHVTYDKYKVNAYVHSDPIEVPQKDLTFHVDIGKGITAARGSDGTPEPLATTVTVPGLYDFLKISSMQLSLVDNERFEPEQILILSTSAGVQQKELDPAVQAWVLPVYDPTDPTEAKEKRPHEWRDPDVVGPELLKKSRPLKLEPIATEKEYDTVHSFRYHADPGRWVYVTVKRGVRAFGGYVLGDPFTGTQKIGEYPAVLHILQSGAIVSLGGSKKVSLYARDVAAVHFTVGRVLTDQLHNLVSQSSGNFASPSFLNSYSFGDENITERFEETEELPKLPHGKPQYLGFDIGKYLASGKRGLFFLKAESWDPESKSSTGEEDTRLILVTDLGVVVKDASDGTHDVFVQSIRSGDPVSGAEVSVIGKNGLPIATAVTDGTGLAHLPTLKDFQHEKQPLLYLVKKSGDSAFLPLARSDRYLDLSRFDVGGVYESGRPNGLAAYLFSDRGIYRPGDEIRVAAIVKPRDWKQSLTGLPLSLDVTDPRGITVRRDTVKLNAAGFLEARHTPPETAPTGSYTFNLRTVKDGQPDSLLGSTTVRVREFLPDRMKISAHLSSERGEGWVSPKDLKGLVKLTNLYGTPASDHKIRASISLVPGLPSFSKLPDFRFFDPKRAKEPVTDTLQEVQTDEEGEAEIPLDLERYAAATYRLTFTAEGFEAEGGRSVVADAQVVVSPLPYLVGYKPDGDLDYMSRGTRRSVQVIAASPTGAPTTVDNLSQVLIERRFVSVLMRQDNGTYKYQSVQKEVELSSKKLSLPAGPTTLSLPTNRPGDFALVIRNGAGDELQRIGYTVAGDADLSRSLEKNAELQIALKTVDIQPGQDLELSIKAPYAGAGVITVERDRVYAHKWFKADTSASVQTIAVPPELEGNGYVSVTFVRDVNSPEVFTSPLSYGVSPFFVARGKRAVKVDLQSPDTARPGDDYTIKYQTDRPSKIVVFAVDEGILRVADYKTPDPLGWFFQKRALEVKTAQILDLILPEFERLVAAAAPGGDAEGEAALGANLNPFKRRRDKPVAFWSGVVDAGPTQREYKVHLPDYWNGTLRVMAVAVSPEAVGASEKRALVRGDFVISPNVPTFAAPGDEFDVGVSVSNNVVGSGKSAKVQLALATSSHLEVIGKREETLTIAELHEAATTFRVRAKDQLGSGALTFTATMGEKHGKLSTDLSVRPAAAYATTFQAGHLRDGQIDVPVSRNLYPEYRQLRAGVSHLPLGLAHGLAAYLEKFPHGCTEQITSQAVPPLVLGDKPDFGYDAKTSRIAVEQAIATLRSRQNDDGGFGLWAANPKTAKFPSVYALHVLTEAKERGYAVPADVMKSGLSWLQTVAADDGDDLDQDRLRAYAIYVLTRNGVVTTTLASSLQKKLEANYPKQWKQDLAGAYLASTWRMLKNERGASAIAEQRFGMSSPWDDYYDGLVHDAQLLYLLARHFPERAKKLTADDINTIVTPIYRGSYNTLESAYTIMALEAYGRTAADATGPNGLAVAEVLDGGQRHALALPQGLLPRVSFTGDAKAIHVGAQGGFDSYWMVSEGGFARTLPTKEVKSKLEVYRDYTDEKGKPVTSVDLGGELLVHVRIRSLTDQAIPDVAIVDLLPGGFEVVVQQPVKNSAEEEHQGDQAADNGEGNEGDNGGDGDEPNEGADDNGGGSFALPIAEGGDFAPDYGDVREDRVVLYGTATTNAQEFVYRIKATNAGKFTTAPILADSMYDRSVLARGLGGAITVEKKQ